MKPHLTLALAGSIALFSTGASAIEDYHTTAERAQLERLTKKAMSATDAALRFMKGWEKKYPPSTIRPLPPRITAPPMKARVGDWIRSHLLLFH